MSSPVIVWFRLDLRLADNPALLAAHNSGQPVIPLFIWDPQAEAPWAPGAATRWWLHQSLQSLAADLGKRGSQLILRQGSPLETLLAVARQSGAERVVWNRRYEPALTERDTAIKAGLKAAGVAADSFNSSLLFEPWERQTREGKPFRVFTPFWRACLTAGTPPAPAAAPSSLAAPPHWPQSAALPDLRLEPTIDWAAGMRTAWVPGENGAQTRLDEFAAHRLRGYPEERNRPDHLGSSRLSPHLHFGEIGPRQVWSAIQRQSLADDAPGTIHGAETYLRELGWREFAHHLLFHFPHTATAPLRPEFESFPWQDDAVAWRAWRRGHTGFPIVDAGMRELWATGWMHNRVRMIVASFLVKDLLLPWQRGAQWFWDTLVDADLANNSLGWQWTAGCGADAAPYFRVFNPVSQGIRFDPAGDYVRRWIPELAQMPAPWIHHPWEAGDAVLQQAGLTLDVDYPRPIVDHAQARQRALAAFETIKRR